MWSTITSQECMFSKVSGIFIAGVGLQVQSLFNLFGGNCEKGMNRVPVGALLCSVSSSPSPTIHTCRFKVIATINFMLYFIVGRCFIIMTYYGRMVYTLNFELSSFKKFVYASCIHKVLLVILFSASFNVENGS